MEGMKNLLATVACTGLLLTACTIPGNDSGGATTSSSSASSFASSSEMAQEAPVFSDSVQAGDMVTSPLTVTGEARGTWYFEASFPVRLLDGLGNEIAVEPAQAQGDWMTTDFVPYSVTLTFSPPATATGTLVLEKDNPSGLPENSGAVHIPVVF